MKNIAVVGLFYGDEGKGTVVDSLCHLEEQQTVVVRFNGGCQTAHNVVQPNGLHHTFAQFGSGTFAGAKTHLSRFMLVEPAGLLNEARHLRWLGVPPLAGLSVHESALLVTPYHIEACRQRERNRGAGRHGSCGLGIWETQRFAREHLDMAPTVGDLRDAWLLRVKLGFLRDWFVDEFSIEPPALNRDAYEVFAEDVRIVDDDWCQDYFRDTHVVFEGSQGVLLDEWHGFHPYTTGTTCTFANADQVSADYGLEAPFRLGVTRCYATRHGNGPFVTEDPSLELPETHNGTGKWMGGFRVGHPDLVALRYALEVCGGVDALAVTNLDRLSPRLKLCMGYRDGHGLFTRLEPGVRGDLEYMAETTGHLFEASPVYGEMPVDADTFGLLLGVPVALESWGPTWRDKKVFGPHLSSTV